MQIDLITGKPVLLCQEAVIQINRTGYEILLQCDGTRRATDIVEELEARYSLAKMTLLREVSEYLEQIDQRGLLQWSQTTVLMVSWRELTYRCPLHCPYCSAKIRAAEIVNHVGLALSLTIWLHRFNIDSLPEIITLAENLGATRFELANTQYYGLAYRNRWLLIPTRAQFETAAHLAFQARQLLVARMKVLYVAPD